MCDFKNNKFNDNLVKFMEAEEEINTTWKRVKEDIIKCVGVEDVMLKIIDRFFDNFVSMLTALRIYYDDGKWFMKCGDEIESIPIYEGFELNMEYFIRDQACNMLLKKFDRSFFIILPALFEKMSKE